MARPAAAINGPDVLPSAGGGHRCAAVLEEGHDAQTVREITGLKLAELDLIQWSPASDQQGVA